MSIIPESYARQQMQPFLFPPLSGNVPLVHNLLPRSRAQPLTGKNAHCLVGRNSCLWTFTRLHCGNRSRSNCSLFRGPLLWQPEANSLCSDWHSSLLFISCHGYRDAEVSCMGSYLSPPAPPALLLFKSWPQADSDLPS